MLIDCFLYNGEDNMLNFRFHELNENVNYFIICESTHTFSGLKKDLKFNINKFNKFKDKIIYLIYDLDPIENNAWLNEKNNRNYLSEGLKNILNLKDNDIIMLSDIDEIPDLDKLNQFNEICSVYLQDFYYYNINCLKKVKWHGTILINLLLLKNNNFEFEKFRSSRYSLPMIIGGWHFSYFMNVNEIVDKINSFSHQEYNSEKYKNENLIIDSIKNKKDLFLRGEAEDLIEGNKNYLPKNIHILTNNKKTLILILNHNLSDLTNTLYSNIKNIENNENFELQILDNGSNIEEVNKLQKKPIRIENNIFFGGALQYAFDIILSNQDKYDGLVFLNNDIYFQCNIFFESLVYTSKINGYKISSPSIFLMGTNNYTQLWKQMSSYNTALPREVKWVDFVCPYIHIDIIKQYKVPDKLKYGYGIDFDICMKCEELGYKVVVFDNISILHYQNYTTKSNVCFELTLEKYYTINSINMDEHFKSNGKYIKYIEYFNWANNYKKNI